MSEQHEPSDQCWGLHCYSCHVDEPAEPSFLICGECGHVYRTARELRRAYRRQLVLTKMFGVPWRSIIARALTARARRILFCQHCTHDGL